MTDARHDAQPAWGAAQRRFIMMPNDIEAYRVGPNAFEFRVPTGS
jgi:hypothetical protein